VNFDHLVVNRERVISVKEWAEIRRLRGEDVSISEIARLTGVARNTVKAALASTSPPKYQRPAKGSAVDAVEPRIRELLREFRGCRPRSSPNGSAGSVA